MSTNNFNSIRLLPNYDNTTLSRKIASKGEVFFDPQTVSIRVFDGLVSGGHLLLRADLSNLSTSISSASLAGNIPNSKLQNSSVTLGTTTVDLGNTAANITGLTSVDALTITGDLTGNVTGDLTGNVTGDTTGTHTGAVVGNVTGNVLGNVTGNLTGNADSATKLQTARMINNQLFDGTIDITVPADSQTLTGSYLAINVTDSSLTTVGTLVGLDVAGNVTLGNAVDITGNTTVGGSVTVGGHVSVSAAPTNKSHVANKNYVDKRAAAMAVALS